jgi:tRNA A-37 threonylcarbamoyl transferase component Bud32
MSDAPTRRDVPPVTRRDDLPTSQGGVAGGMELAAGAAGTGGQRKSVFNLPEALARHWRMLAPLPAHGAEAELFVVQRLDGEERAVAKLYRPGIRPRAEAVERIARVACEHIVRILERGESEGISYELMEYCKFGSLRNLIEDDAADPRWLRQVVAQLADALTVLHREGIIHRDLKPENVLVRSLEPVQVALTDFGISSLAESTHHFTSTNRTVRYAPPEAMTGILTVKADYWSLGMIILEMYTGRHPFAGLSEAVINHLLITRPIDLTAIDDAAWRSLLRGLLMRNPDKRWSDTEVRRWVEGDPSLDVLAELADEGVLAATVRPYEMGTKACTTAAELAVALMSQWDAGARDLARGFVTAWLRDELHDQNLVRFVMDLMDDPSLTPDLRLLRFALRAAPGMPAVWRGSPLTDESLSTLTRAALNGGTQERLLLASIYEQDALLMFPEGHADGRRLLALRERWRRRADICQQVQLRLVTDEQEARRQVRASAAFANFDELVYGGGAERLTPPDPSPHPVLLAPEFAPEELERIRQRVAAAMLNHCPWFRGSVELARLGVEELAALEAAAPRARRFADEARGRQARTDEAAVKEAAALRADVDAMLRTARGFTSRTASSVNVRAGMQGVYETYQRLFGRAHAESAVHPHFEPIRRTLGRAGSRFLHIMESIDRLDYLGRLRTLVLRDGWPFAIAMILLPFVARLPALLGLELVICAGALGWYGYERAFALDRIRRYAARLPGEVEDLPADPATGPATSEPRRGEAAPDS